MMHSLYAYTHTVCLYVYVCVYGRSFLTIGGTSFFAILSKADLDKASRYIYNMQINSGWIVIPDLLIRQELMASSIMHGIDLKYMYFYIPVSSSSPTTGVYICVC